MKSNQLTKQTPQLALPGTSAPDEKADNLPYPRLTDEKANNAPYSRLAVDVDGSPPDAPPFEAEQSTSTDLENTAAESEAESEEAIAEAASKIHSQKPLSASQHQHFSEQFTFSGPYRGHYKSFLQQAHQSPLMRTLSGKNILSKSKHALVQHFGEGIHCDDAKNYFKPTPESLINAGLFLSTFFSYEKHTQAIEEGRQNRSKVFGKDLAAAKCISFLTMRCAQYKFCIIGLSHQHSEDDEQLRTYITTTCEALNSGVVKFYLAPKASDNTHQLIAEGLQALECQPANLPQRNCAEKAYFSVMLKISYLSPEIVGAINCAFAAPYKQREISKDAMKVSLFSKSADNEAKTLTQSQYYNIKENCDDCQSNYRAVMLLLSTIKSSATPVLKSPLSPLSRCGAAFFQQAVNPVDMKDTQPICHSNIAVELILKGRSKDDKQNEKMNSAKAQKKAAKKARRLEVTSEKLKTTERLQPNRTKI